MERNNPFHNGVGMKGVEYLFELEKAEIVQ